MNKNLLPLVKHWASMIFGSSYWHSAQGVGKLFKSGEVVDYYRDYSTKASWKGATDHQGFPLVKEIDKPPFRHPLVLAQKALGHWSCWLASNKEQFEHHRIFINLANWLVEEQEVGGGWKILSMEKPMYTSPYSALAQGQAVSVLVRAFLETLERKYLESAEQGLLFMLQPVASGGTSRITGNDLILEEYPKSSPNTVLNGWVSAIFGLYDFLLVEKKQFLEDSLEATLKTLVKYLPRFNANFWSFYDTSGTIASPYYHKVHMTQLRALQLTFPHYSNSFDLLLRDFENQFASYSCFTRAFLLKAMQKLKNPPSTVLMQPKPL